MSRVQLTLACGAYDRTEALRTAEVVPEGIDLVYLPLAPEETFYRSLRYREFEVAELSLSSYLMDYAGRGDFIAIPVFPSRAFRHNGIYVRSDSPIEEPRQLRGRTVGVPEYQMTAAVWIRGTLAERHDLPVDSVQYRTGGLVVPGRTEKLALPSAVTADVRPLPAHTTLTEALVGGDIDALYTARLPEQFQPDGSGRLRRLFTDVRAVEERYFADTGIFPIMHTLVLRRDVYERWPWVARSLYDAFDRSRRVALARIAETNALRYSLPWLYADIDAVRTTMGHDYWDYGLATNETTLRTLIGYSHEQGLIPHAYQVEEIFAAETVESFRV